MTPDTSQIVVVGSGNAGFAAALAARERGASVLLVDRGDDSWIGGNSYFSAGAIRTTHTGVEDLRELLHQADPEMLAATDLPPYGAEDFRQDMTRVTRGRCDPELVDVLVSEIGPCVRWLHGQGLRFRLMYDRQSFTVDGRHMFWGNLSLGTVGGGKGLIEQYRDAARTAGIEVRSDTLVRDVVFDDCGGVRGVSLEDGSSLPASAVVLASGGFEADARLRATHLGPGWDLAKVRGTPHNTGSLLMRVIEHGAQSAGHWSGCHATAWDAAAPSSGDLEITNLYTKQSYPIGIVVNVNGERFIDEGADFRNYTYAKYGAEVLRQPDALAFQLFDAQTAPLLRQDEYTAPGVSRIEAETIDDLAEQLAMPDGALQQTIRGFNASIRTDRPFNPAIKDGRGTHGLAVPKSHWAVALEQPPFLAFAVTCGITYTFGGLRIDSDARVIGSTGRPIPGLFAAGEIAGGLFFHNYPGGSGLAAGAVFGRRAGWGAAAAG